MLAVIPMKFCVISLKILCGKKSGKDTALPITVKENFNGKFSIGFCSAAIAGVANSCDYYVATSMPWILFDFKRKKWRLNITSMQ